jgi:hypothetical protein
VSDLVSIAAELAVGVNGVDWDGSRVQASSDALLRASRGADPATLDRALGVLNWDRPGACALAYLKQWVLPTVAAR